MNRSLLTLAAALLTSVCPLPAPAQGTPVPRYKLEVGQELTYDFEFPYKNPDGSILKERTTWTVWVADNAGQGGWRVVARKSTSYANEKPSPGPTSEPDTQTFVGACTLSPDGHTAAESREMGRVEIASIFPVLPPDPGRGASGWDDVDARNAVTTHSRLTGAPDAAEVVFESTTEGPIERIYLGAGRTSVFQIDRDKGRVVQAQVTSPYAYGLPGRASGTLRLSRVDQRDATWVKALRDEAGVAVAAESSYLDLLHKATFGGGSLASPARSPANDPVSRYFRSKVVEAEARPRLKAAREVLQKAKGQVTSPVFREMLDMWLTNHDRVLNSTVREAVLCDWIVHRPAPDFAWKDLDGRPHALKDYRGKVVVLDFWHRNCPWCLRAMPQVN
jgi:hypothetical protein